MVRSISIRISTRNPVSCLVIAVALSFGALLFPVSGVLAQPPSFPDMGERTTSVSCYNDYYKHHGVVRGAFTKKNSRSSMYLSNRNKDGCLLEHEEGRKPERIEADGASIVGACRDPDSGLDHAVVWTRAGNRYAEIRIFSVDPSTSNPELLYREAWGSNPSKADDEWGISQLVAADGTCLWRRRKKADELFYEAMSALKVGNETRNVFREAFSARSSGKEKEFPQISVLPTRNVPAATVCKWLKAIEGIAVLERAVYADHDAREEWRLVQVYRTKRCNAEGVVLLHNRRTGLWKTIYDVPSGCSYRLNYPMRAMVIKEDRLFVSACVDCESWGEYRDFSVDLRTYRIKALEPGANPTGPRERENPPIRNLDEEFFAK